MLSEGSGEDDEERAYDDELPDGETDRNDAREDGFHGEEPYERDEEEENRLDEKGIENMSVSFLDECREDVFSHTESVITVKNIDRGCLP